MLQENNAYSQFRNTTVRDLNRISQTVRDVELFKNNYESLINGVIKGLNNQFNHYKHVSYDAIKADIFEAVRQNFENEDTSNELKIMLNNNIKPINNHNFKSLPSIPEYDFEFDDESIISMYEYTHSPFSDKNKSDKKEFIKCQKETLSNINDYNRNVEKFESDLCKYREKAIKIMNNNLLYLIAAHYNYAYNIKNKLIKNIPQTLKVDNFELQLVPSQKTFLTNAVKTIINSIN
jgi:hypothetical protein